MLVSNANDQIYLERDQCEISVITQDFVYVTKFCEDIHLGCLPISWRQLSQATLTIYEKYLFSKRFSNVI